LRCLATIKHPSFFFLSWQCFDSLLLIMTLRQSTERPKIKQPAQRLRHRAPSQRTGGTLPRELFGSIGKLSVGAFPQREKTFDK
jgi:hypothetical protein